MRNNIFDFNDGGFLHSVSDNMAMDQDGDMFLRMSDNTAMDMNTGELHIVSMWKNEDDED